MNFSLPYISKKNLLIILLIILVFLAISTLVANILYINNLNSTHAQNESEYKKLILGASGNISKFDASKLSDTSIALNELEKLHTNLRKLSEYDEYAFKPLLVKTPSFEQSEKKLIDLNDDIKKLEKVLSTLI